MQRTYRYKKQTYLLQNYCTNHHIMFEKTNDLASLLAIFCSFTQTEIEQFWNFFPRFVYMHIYPNLEQPY